MWVEIMLWAVLLMLLQDIMAVKCNQM